MPVPTIICTFWLLLHKNDDFLYKKWQQIYGEIPGPYLTLNFCLKFLFGKITHRESLLDSFILYFLFSLLKLET